MKAKLLSLVSHFLHLNDERKEIRQWYPSQKMLESAFVNSGPFYKLCPSKHEVMPLSEKDCIYVRVIQTVSRLVAFINTIKHSDKIIGFCK